MTKTKTAPALVAPEFMGRKVLSVYSGKPGCCCGCLGKHTYHPATQLAGGIVRGYEVVADEVSARGVSIILGKMRKFLDSGMPLEEGGNNVSYETDTRLYIIYWLPSDEKLAQTVANRQLRDSIVRGLRADEAAQEAAKTVSFIYGLM